MPSGDMPCSAKKSMVSTATRTASALSWRRPWSSAAWATSPAMPDQEKPTKRWKYSLGKNRPSPVGASPYTQRPT